MCKDCQAEIKDPKNRRFQYAFATCVNCGPRYVITQKFPFERENTSMAAFKMCADCEAEYKKPSNRRFHFQTNSCPQCGINLILKNKKGEVIEKDQGNIIKKNS